MLVGVFVGGLTAIVTYYVLALLLLLTVTGEIGGTLAHTDAGMSRALPGSTAFWLRLSFLVLGSAIGGFVAAALAGRAAVTAGALSSWLLLSLGLKSIERHSHAEPSRREILIVGSMTAFAAAGGYIWRRRHQHRQAVTP